MDPRTLDALVEITRERLDDHGLTKPRFATSSIVRGLNEGEAEAAFRAKLLRDDVASCTRIPLIVDTSTYLLNAAIFEVCSARLLSTGERLSEASEDQLYRENSRWRTATGTPREFVIQVLPNEQLRLVLASKPTVADTLQLDVYRLPLFGMSDGADEPELAARHHDGLVDWAVYRCCSVKDPDLYDPQKASDHLALFEAQFGKRDDANVHRKKRERVSCVVVPRD